MMFDLVVVSAFEPLSYCSSLTAMLYHSFVMVFDFVVVWVLKPLGYRLVVHIRLAPHPDKQTGWTEAAGSSPAVEE